MSTASSSSLSWKNSRAAAQEEIMGGVSKSRDENRQQKQLSPPPPPPKNAPTHIPLTSNNKIPSQILNVISSSADPSMTFIDLDNNPLGDSEVSKLAYALMTNSTVHILSLRNCNITNKAVQTLADCLQRNTVITALYLDANRISREGCATLSTALIKNETLSVLTLNRNHDLGDKGVVYLMNALEHNSKLLTLEVKDCGVHENRLNQIESILADRQMDSNFESLLERLRDDDFRVTGIDLSGRRIGNEGVRRLAEALSDNTQVRQLWLRSCQIGDEGAKALASCLEQNMAVVDLYLANNAIGDEGVRAIADALGLSNLTLVTLELNDNRVGDKGIDALTRAMERNTSVLEATFENNSMLRHSTKLQKLQRMLQERRSGLNKVSFVVDPENIADEETEKEKKGIVDMSICSSYMPSIYRRAGFNSLTDSKPVKVANKAKKGQDVAAPSAPPPPPTPNRNRESSRKVSPSPPDATRLVAMNTDSSGAIDPPKPNEPAHMSPIPERSYEWWPSNGTSSSRSSKMSVRKAALVPLDEVKKTPDLEKSTHPPGSTLDDLERSPHPPGAGAKSSDFSLSDPQTQRNFDDTLKTLSRRVETMVRINHFASIHYRARHYWFFFVPISSCIFSSGVLGLANAFNTGSARFGLGLSTCALLLLAFVLNLLQTRFGWSSLAEIHSSTLFELNQVSFRLESLTMYQNGKLLSASLSPDSRAHAIRDLYRVDVYLQAMQQCTPDAPEPISEAFHQMASRMRLMWLRYPHTVKNLFAEYSEEPADSSSSVPVAMHVDALDLLGYEIQEYAFYPLFLPDPSKVVSRSIDIFFSPRAQNTAPSNAGPVHYFYDDEDSDHESVYTYEESYDESY